MSDVIARFPYITDYVNDVFAGEAKQWDFIILRPILLVVYFFVRFISFPLQFVLHRWPWGFESRAIDFCMAVGMKYLARPEAAELFMRHVQIEPLLYRHILSRRDAPFEMTGEKLKGIFGDFGVDDLATVMRCQMTIGHDKLSYEIVDRFDKQTFLDNLDYIRSLKPTDHEQFSKRVLEENRKHTWGLLGPTNVVMLIVMSITVFGDLKTTVTALNSFGSDSILLWCLKRIYAHDTHVQSDLDFFMQEVANRGHYSNSAFFSNPSQYLYYHIVFDEVAYDLLTNVPPTSEPRASAAPAGQGG